MTAHSQRQHARLAPSAAHIWMNCPGSVQLSEGLEDGESVYAAEGTAAHELAAMCLMRGEDAEQWRGYWINSDTGAFTAYFPGAKSAHVQHIFEVNAEMIDGVQLYLDVVREIDADDFDYEVRLETPIEGCFGTGDTIAYNEEKRRLTVADFKYGRGVAVEVQGNEQLLTYAAGSVMRLHNHGVEEIELIVVQPRAAHHAGLVRRWTTTPEELRAHVARAQNAAASTELVPGSHCKFCPAAGFCPALREKVLNVVDATRIDGEIVGMADPEKFTPEEIARSLRNSAIVANWVRSVEKLGHAQASKGNTPPGFKFVATRTHRSFKNEEEAAETLVMMGVAPDLLFETEMRSPAQLEKELPRKARDVMAGLTIKKSSRLILAPVEDPRPAVTTLETSGFEAMEGENE